MSLRAYKLIEIKTEDAPTFNLWYDDRINDIVDEQDEKTSFSTIQKENAEDLLEKIEYELKNQKNTEKEKEELKYYVKTLKQIIADCGDEEYCDYYCY